MWSARSSTVCRACLTEDTGDFVGFSQNIFLGVDQKYKVATSFEDISTIELKNDEANTSKLCPDCYRDLQTAMQFKVRSNESNRRILLDIENEDIKNNDEPEISLAVLFENEDIKMETKDFLLPDDEEELNFSTNKIPRSYEKKLYGFFICDRCGKNFSRKPFLRDHMRHCLLMQNYSGTDKPFSELPVCGKIWEDKKQRVRVICLECNILMTSYMIFRRHYYTVHLDQNALIQQEKRSSNKILPSKPSGNLEFPFQCSACGDNFSSKRLHDDHRVQHQYSLECEICRARFRSAKGLSDHADFFKGEPHDLQDSLRRVPPLDIYQCVFCLKYLMDCTTLKNHYKFLHQNQQPEICELCKRQFASHQELLEHTKDMEGKTHTRNNVNSSLNAFFKCLKCHADFLTDQQLQEHTTKCKKIKQKKTERHCQHCPQIIFGDKEFQSHMLKHGMTKGYECNMCPKSFKVMESWKQHVATHNKIPSLICSTCGKQFKTKPALKFHNRRYHETEFLLSCDHCDKTFTTNTQLRRHTLAHLKKHAFTCTACEMNFNIPNLAKDHVLRHHLNFSIDCSLCNRKYFEKRKLQRHLHNNHDDDPLFKDAWETCKNVPLPIIKDLIENGCIRLNNVLDV